MAAVAFVAVLLLFLSALFCSSHQKDVFSSVRHMEWLLETEKSLASHLQIYVNNERRRIAKAEQLLNSIPQLDDGKTRKKNDAGSAGHPLDALLVMRRMTRDWRGFDRVVRRDVSAGFLDILKRAKPGFPSTSDFGGAQDALLRLQATYDLDAAKLSDGIVTNAPTLSKMNADDAFEIGRKAYGLKDFKTTSVWMGEALRLIDMRRQPTPQDPDLAVVLDHLAWSEYMNGDVKKALNVTKTLLTLEPQNERILANAAAFKEKLLRTKSNGTQSTKSRESKSTQKPFRYEKFTEEEYDDESFHRLYHVEQATARSLCRGETEAIPVWMRPRLTCWLRQDHPLFVLKPAKTERIYENPEILFYRGAISDGDIARIQNVASPLLNRATVHNPATGELEFANYRISKSAWLHGYADPAVEALNQRISAFTRLSLDTAEMLQVANYGIAGHYDTHFDFSRLSKSMMSEQQRKHGKRIATFLTYLSDVEMGGGTVFTNIGVTVVPSKGDAIFWHNLKRDGSGDYNTRHAACPVLFGNKWIANKWIHEFGQEFRRRCDLKPNS